MEETELTAKQSQELYKLKMEQFITALKSSVLGQELEKAIISDLTFGEQLGSKLKSEESAFSKYMLENGSNINYLKQGNNIADLEKYIKCDIGQVISSLMGINSTDIQEMLMHNPNIGAQIVDNSKKNGSDSIAKLSAPDSADIVDELIYIQQSSEAMIDNDLINSQKTVCEKGAIVFDLVMAQYNKIFNTKINVQISDSDLEQVGASARKINDNGIVDKSIQSKYEEFVRSYDSDHDKELSESELQELIDKLKKGEAIKMKTSNESGFSSSIDVTYSNKTIHVPVRLSKNIKSSSIDL